MTDKVKGKRKNIEGVTMKKQILYLVTLTALLITPLAFAGAGAAVDLKANIPFDFVVGNKSMPAGEYMIRKSSTPGLVQLSNFEEKANVMVITQVVRNLKASKGSRLEFRRYGNQYFLGNIWTEGLQVSHEIQVSRTERKAIDNAKYLAGHSVKPEIVSVDCQ